MGKGRATILFKVSIDMNEETPNEIDLRMSKLKEVSSKSNSKTFLTLPDSNAIEYNINKKGFIIPTSCDSKFDKIHLDRL